MIKEDEARLLRQTVDLAVKSASDASGRAQRAGRASMAACGAAAVAVAGAAFFGGMLAGSLNGGGAGNGGFSAPVYAPVFAGGMPNAQADAKGRTWDLPTPGKGKARRAMWMDDPLFVPAALDAGEEPAPLPPAKAEEANAEEAGMEAEDVAAETVAEIDSMDGAGTMSDIQEDAEAEADVPDGAEAHAAVLGGAEAETPETAFAAHAADVSRLRTQMVPLSRYRSYADRCRILGQPVPEGTFCFDSQGREMFCMRLNPEAAAAWDRWDLESYRAEAAARLERQEAQERHGASRDPEQRRADKRRHAAQEVQQPALQPSRPAVQAPAPQTAASGIPAAPAGIQAGARHVGSAPVQGAGTPGVRLAASPDALLRSMAEPAGALDAAIAARRGLPAPAPSASRLPAGAKPVNAGPATVDPPKLSASQADIAVKLAKGTPVPVRRELSPLQKEGRLRSETSDPRAYPEGAKLSYSGFIPVPPEKMNETAAAAMAKPKIARERFDALLRDAPGLHLAGTPKEGRTALAVLVQPGCTACMAVSGLLEKQAANMPFPVYLIPANRGSALAIYPSAANDAAIRSEAELLGENAAKFLASTGRAVTPTYVWAMDGEVHAGTLKGAELTAVVGLLSAHARACGARSKAEEDKAQKAKTAPAKAEAPKADAPKPEAAKAD